jgi:demethylmenaquinone methyltransferase/2-methoxy-6-polyprenyl-1,4-benzoquinol methylase
VHPGSPDRELDELLAEQIAYYRARAGEYDETASFRAYQGYAELVAALDRFAPSGTVLELACGTGQWTAELAKRAASVTAVDASPEMLAINRDAVARDNVRYVESDLFKWSPPARYDAVFFSAWLSHVPPQRFEDFWGLVDRGLTDTGRVFMIDELPAVADIEHVLEGTVAPAVERPLRSGARHRAVKVWWEPGELIERLRKLGWRAEIHPVGWRFFYGVVERLA